MPDYSSSRKSNKATPQNIRADAWERHFAGSENLTQRQQVATGNSPSNVRFVRVRILLVIVGLLTMAVSPMAPAGPQLFRSGPSPDQVTESETQRLAQGLPSDRKTILTLQSLRKHIVDGQPELAVDELRRLKACDPNSMVPEKSGSKTFIPLHRAAFDAWLNLPGAQRLRFQESQESSGEKALKEILADGMTPALPGFILKYVGTTASIKAHLVVARLHLARGNRLAAEIWLKPLQHKNVAAGFRDAALRVLSDLAGNGATKPSAVGQSSSASDGIPGNLLWQYRPLASPQLQGQITKFVRAAAASNVLLQSSWTEQQQGSVSFRRTMRGIAAINLSSGESLWECPLEPALGNSVTSDNTNNVLFQKLQSEFISEDAFARLEYTAIANTFCRNEVLGSVAVDNDRVYAITIDAVGVSVAPRTGPAFLIPSTNRGPIKNLRLIALEKTTGRRVWTVNASSMQESLKTASNQLWIAGPPVVSNANLFGIVEWNGQILLTCFAARTGEVKWKHTLAFPEQTIERDAVRQLRGAKPSVKSGLIWCPTTTDRLVCVDELTQSTVWAGILPANTEKQKRYAPGRGRAVALTGAASIKRRWSHSEIIVSGSRIAVMSPQSHEVFMFDALTGVPQNSITVLPSSIVIHSDSSRIVIAEPQKVYCIATDTGEQVWSSAVDTQTGKPTGRGLLKGPHLLVPMDNGNVLSFNVNDGKRKETAKSILPPSPWGQLLSSESLNGDLVYAAPERLMRLSTQPPTETSKNAVELAVGHLASGNLERALELADQVGSSESDYRDAQRVRFECLLQLAIRSPADHLERLKEAANTSQQQTQVRFLEINSLLNSEQKEEAALRLIEVLQLPSPLADARAPMAQYNIDAAIGNQVRVSVPLRTWAGSLLSRLLQEGTLADKVWNKVSSLPPASLLSLDVAGVRTLLQKSAESESSVETAVHLLRHSMYVAKSESPNLSEEVRILGNIIQQHQHDEPSSIEAATSALLNSAVLELSKPVIQSLRDSSAADMLTGKQSLDDNQRAAFQERAEKWTALPFQVVPITRNTSAANRTGVMLSTVVTDDVFLRQFQWTATRGDSGRLVGRNDSTQWSIPGTFSVYGNYSNRTDTLYRLGTLLLVRSFNSIAVVSILDRRVIWSRNYSKRNQVVTTNRSISNFEQYDRSRDRLPSEEQYHNSPLQLVGTGDRWICVKYENDIEIIDTLLGSTVWSAVLLEPRSVVTATDDVVVVSGPGGDEMCFRRDTGDAIEIAAAEDLATRTIRSVGSQLVCWKVGDRGQPSALEWVDPRSNEVAKQLPLVDCTHFRFLDDATLLGFNNRFQFTIVDLVSGDLQTGSFGIDGQDARVEINEKRDAEDSLNDPPLWDARRIRVAADGLNLYFTNTPERSPQLFRQPSGRELTRYTGGLRAVDRQTGKLRWWTKGNRGQLAVTDQPDLPVLILIESDAPAVAAATPPYTRNAFKAVNKVTGEPLFEKTVPSRFGLRYLGIQSPAANVLDISVYGNQMRITGVQPATAVDSDK